MDENTKAAFFDELEKIAFAPVALGLAADVGMAGVDAAHGSYKAIRHGKNELSTKLPYNPATAANWAANKAIHKGSSKWALSKSMPKKVIGRAGLVASKIGDAALQADPINAAGSLAHSGVNWLRKRRAQRAVGRVIPTR